MTSGLPYRLGRALGTGGYAEVFRAVPRDGGDTVALKRGLGASSEGAARLRREIKVQRTLDHPNVMPVLDSDQFGAWYTMPLAHGSLLQLRQDRLTAVSATDLALEVLEQASQGLEYAHDQGYLHRDVTPGNILGYQERDGEFRWVVADWGMVRRPVGMTTHSLTGGEGLGTAGFAAPETYEGDAHEVDERADVYSLGRLAAWILTGTWPRPNLALRPDGSLRGFMDECTDLDMRRRPASMAEMRTRLEELTSQPAMSPRGEVQALLETVPTDAAATSRIIELALRNKENDEIWIDELARLPLDEVTNFARANPEVATEAALILLGQLDQQTYGHRDFKYLNTPLRWAHEVVRVLFVEGHEGLAEDVATKSFELEEAWDQWPQKRVTVAWLQSLQEPEGVVIARAMRRSGAAKYYEGALASGRIRSRSLAAEFGR